MEVGRIAIGLGFFGMAILSFFMFTTEPQGLTVTEARLEPMGAGLALTATINNPGAPDRLVGVASDSASGAMFMGASGDLALPQAGSAQLSMDGVHAMLRGVQGSTEQGRLLPVTLWFERAGKISTRARIGATMGMDHGGLHTPAADAPQPAVTMDVFEVSGAWALRVSVENFTFSEDAADGPHVPGQGHGHLYLNGLKLARIYGPEHQIGALPPGTYEISVGLNTNDHKTYAVGGRPVFAAQTITVE